jgi:hypothetical protein
VPSDVGLRLLLDQNFPKPRGFNLADLTTPIHATHVSSHDPGLTAPGVPDWLLYLRAADDGFDALVTRDRHQLDQPEELWVLANLRIVVVSWREPVNDAVAEWGQLLAYMPQLRRWVERQRPRVVLLPPPHLDEGDEVNPREALGRYAARNGRAVAEVLAETRSAVRSALHRAERGDLYVRLERVQQPGGE